MYQPGLHALCQLSCIAAAAIAGGLWLYRYLGGAGIGAGRDIADSDITGYRPLFAPSGYAQAGDVQLYYVRLLFLLACVYVRTGDGFWRFRMAAVYSGVRRGLLLHAADHHYFFRVSAGTYGGGIQFVELYPYSDGVNRYVDYHDDVVKPRVAASCTANGKHHAV